jgi:hypothetical protein
VTLDLFNDIFQLLGLYIASNCRVMCEGFAASDNHNKPSVKICSLGSVSNPESPEYEVGVLIT